MYDTGEYSVSDLAEVFSVSHCLPHPSAATHRHIAIKKPRQTPIKLTPCYTRYFMFNLI